MSIAPVVCVGFDYKPNHKFPYYTTIDKYQPLFNSASQQKARSTRICAGFVPRSGDGLIFVKNEMVRCDIFCLSILITEAIMEISIESCISAIGAAAFHRVKGLRIELAVGLAVYAMHEQVNNESKVNLQMVYSAAGNDCLDAMGADYQTVIRRRNASAALFEKITLKGVLAWIGDKKDDEAINAIVAEIEKIGLCSIEDVKAYAGVATDGRREKRTYTPTDHPLRRQEDVEYVRVVETAHIRIGIPEGVGARELVTAANRLLKVAQEMRQVA